MLPGPAFPLTSAHVAIDSAAFVHPSAQIYGKVRLGAGVSVWPNAVIRAEAHEVVIGEGSNVQDFVMIHVGSGFPTIVGANCSITHRVTLHGCTLGDNVLVGIGATIMDGSVIGENSIIAGGAFLKEGTIVPANSIVAGIPAVVKASRDNSRANRFNAWLYAKNAEAYARGEHRVWADIDLLNAQARFGAEPSQ
ncbi:gamma carbonic anhydrase family protein [Phreatobacter aquaticus]|uniref:Gamma carbonic anhydrase family protein n=1 Tax=Phreatobacter aquaticus TaxID=2570229 RepID=A0A4D7QMN4_9HYPH|nr:gamma carbonic anhydrase family protein [Phreatobacter aquaticus]QCK86544.1 gamma carbonic anhydrase family protein [Phreatobacter aquaticus]